MKKEGLDRAIILIVAILVVLGGAAVLVASYVRTDEISELEEAGGQVSILVTIDVPGERLISQVLYLDTATSRAALFDIPANTGVVVESLNRVDGIDTVYRTSGVDAFREEVADLLGAPVDYQLVMSIDDLEMLVDFLEGVPLFVADIPDFGPDALLIPSGDVVLDGAQMQMYVGFAPEGERDRERIARAQKAVAGLIGRLGEQAALVSEPDAATAILAGIETNLDRRGLVSLANVLGSLELDRIITRQVEGTIRQVETEETSEALLFPHQEGRWLEESVRQVIDNLKTNESLRDENIVITLEILNGTSNSGLARRTAELYQSYGFDVVTVGNAARDDVGETLIIDRTGNEIFANRTAEIIRATSVELELEAGTGVDVTIVLGEDFDGRYVR